MARAKDNDYTDDSAPAPSQPISKAPSWEPPTSDQEFVFESIEKAPAWVDKGWAGFDRGPALQLPAGDIYGEGPYTTKTARVGDTVKFMAAKGGMGPRFEVIAALPDPNMEGTSTKKPPQQSAVSLEEALKSGAMAPDDLGADAKAQVVQRSPKLRGLIEEGKGAPDPAKVADVVKLD